MGAIINKGPTKADIAMRFSRAALDYDAHAEIQHKIVSELINWAGADAQNLGTVVDIGSGTGALARRLALPQRIQQTQQKAHTSLWCNLDISMGMLRGARKSAVYGEQVYIRADAEQLPLADGSIDTVVSSMALQWCQSPHIALNEIYRVLSDKGRAYIALMISPSFSQLHRAWSDVGLPSRVNTFSDATTWLNAAGRHSWHIAYQQKTFYSAHDGLVSMLKSIKGVGANTQLASKPVNALLSKGEIKAVESAMRRGLQSANPAQAYNLDYEVLFLSLDKTMRL
ncbi:methyltransferase domain-containing protein [Glaciecola siphonariae]|uniref:Methyltransferase domain-containing protein n=1 Tax=Glaciecola siphonariae TaxID=521012 RepID=A0ABV9LR09_9ALTE